MVRVIGVDAFIHVIESLAQHIRDTDGQSSYSYSLGSNPKLYQI